MSHTTKKRKISPKRRTVALPPKYINRSSKRSIKAFVNKTLNTSTSLSNRKLSLLSKSQTPNNLVNNSPSLGQQK